MRNSDDRRAELAQALEAESDEEVDATFWSGPHEWQRLDDPALVNYIKDRFTDAFIQHAGLSRTRAPIVRRHLHVGYGTDEAGSYISGTFGLLGTTYFHYEDPDDRALLDDWINELAELQAGNFEH